MAHGYGLREEERKELTEQIARLNLAYFSGDLRGFQSFDAQGNEDLWENDGTLVSFYLRSLTDEIGKNCTEWKNG